MVFIENKLLTQFCIETCMNYLGDVAAMGLLVLLKLAPQQTAPSTAFTASTAYPCWHLPPPAHDAVKLASHALVCQSGRQ